CSAAPAPADQGRSGGDDRPQSAPGPPRRRADNSGHCSYTHDPARRPVMSHLVIVHGIGGKPAPDVLRESCRFFLEGSTATHIPADRLRLASWADLAGYPPEVDDRGSFRPYTAAERLAIAAGGLVKERAIGVVEAKLSEALHREAAPNNAEAAALAGLLAFVTGPVTLLLLKEFLRDVYVYFRGGIREPVKDRVR